MYVELIQTFSTKYSLKNLANSFSKTQISNKQSKIVCMIKINRRDNIISRSVRFVYVRVISTLAQNQTRGIAKIEIEIESDKFVCLV